MKMFRNSVIAFGLLIAAFTHAQTVDKKPSARTEVIAKVKSLIETDAFVPGVDFKKFDKFLQDQSAKLDAASDDESFTDAVNSALKSFGFSHIMLASPKTWKARTTGSSIGIGISSQNVPLGKQITRVIEKSPAAEVGLEVGDIITHANDQPVGSEMLPTGSEGSKIKIRVRKSNGKIFDFEITRRPFSTIRTDELRWLPNSTAILKIHSFEKGYKEDYIASLMGDAVKAENLIIDLRFNGGGQVSNLLDLGGYFLDKRISMGSMLFRTSLDRYRKKYNKEPEKLADMIPFAFTRMNPYDQEVKFKGNVIILANSGSASASEIFAAALKDQYRKKVNSNGETVIDPDKGEIQIVGSNSAGAVLFSTYMDASNGFFLQIPVGDYLTPSGVRIEGNPIQPDLSAKAPQSTMPGTEDPQIDAALALFERIKLRNQRSKG